MTAGSGGSDGQRRVAIFDLDRTLTRQATYTPFLLASQRGRPLRQACALLGVLPSLLGYAGGRIGRGALKERMLALTLAGATREEVEAHAKGFAAAWLARQLRPAARGICEKHLAAGDHLMLATASFDFYARCFAEGLGLHDVTATLSTWSPEDRLQPLLAGENCYGEEKLRRVQKALPWPRETCYVIAYSDHHSDLPLLTWADEGVAVNPSRRLARAAEARGLRIADWDHPDADS